MMKMKKKSKAAAIIMAVFSCLLLFLGALFYFSANWYLKVFGDLGFDSILFTLFSNMGGVQDGLIEGYLIKAFLPIIGFTAAISVVILIQPKKALKIKLFNKKVLKLFPFKRWVALVLSIVIFISMSLTAAFRVGLVDYVVKSYQTTEIFDKEYVDPLSAEIKFPEKKRNLIYIYLESMETSYMSKELGGALPYNTIPELYDLANSEENINFSHNDGVGGFSCISGANWTIGAIVGQTAGIPLKVPANFSQNTYGSDRFMRGAASITNVLKNNGYYQVFMVGSDSAFANRDRYYLDHGVDKVYDLYSARADGIVPNDYKVWWGMEDKHLFTYAKRVLNEISKKDQPFAFTTLTVDTHHVAGYKCEYCEDTYVEQYENVMSCSSRQVYEFLEWIKAQPFYENTTVVITGDHLSMDSGYFSRNVDSSYERKVYNCFVNSVASTENTKNRVFTAFDMFPTTLAAMGCEITGDRLGLGTNLFSSTPTMPEKMGYKKFENEISKSSLYYSVEFMFK